MVRGWKNRFGLAGERIWVAPLVALVLVAVGQLSNPGGDIREGAFPWLMASAAVGLGLLCLRLVAVHGSEPGRWVAVGGWWAALAFAGIASFLVAVGVGAMFGIEEDSLGWLAWLPVSAMAFGLVSMTPALALLAVGAGRASVLPRWGVWALWTLSPLLVGLLIYGGLADGSAESVGSSVILAVLAVGWVVVGLAVRPTVLSADQ